MPAQSRRQQRYLFATKGAAWVEQHHFDKLAPGAPTNPKAHAHLQRGRHTHPKKGT